MEEKYLDFAIGIADYAGITMRKYFNRDMDVERKEDNTPVTLVDKQINSYLIEQVKKKFPNHGVCGEEEKYNENSEYLWVCDPVDGTSMYIRHIPVSVFSLALVIDGEPIVGVVYDPFLNEIYTSIKGRGAFCNSKKINVDEKVFGDFGCVVDVCMWNNAKYDTLELLKEIRKEVKLTQMGSVARACMAVASGKISAEVFPGTIHGNCDVAASKLIVEEAGGVVTDFHGNDQRYDVDIDGAIITNKKINEMMLKKVRDIYGN